MSNNSRTRPRPRARPRAPVRLLRLPRFPPDALTFLDPIPDDYAIDPDYMYTARLPLKDKNKWIRYAGKIWKRTGDMFKIKKWYVAKGGLPYMSEAGHITVPLRFYGTPPYGLQCYEQQVIGKAWEMCPRLKIHHEAIARDPSVPEHIRLRVSNLLHVVTGKTYSVPKVSSFHAHQFDRG